MTIGMLRIWAGACTAAALAMAAVPAVADAHCTSSTPSSTSFVDKPSDGKGVAPEITTVVVSVDATCHFTVDPGIAKPLEDGSGVLVAINTDGDAATGAPGFGGAEVAVVTGAVAGRPTRPILSVYDAWSGTVYPLFSRSLTAVGRGGFIATLDQLGIVKPATMRVVVWAAGGNARTWGSDLAPEPTHSPIPFPLAFASDGNALPAPALPSGCTVPRVSGFTQRGALRLLRAAGCHNPLVSHDYNSSVPRGHVIDSFPSAGSRWRLGVFLTVSRGPRPRRRHAR